MAVVVATEATNVVFDIYSSSSRSIARILADMSGFSRKNWQVAQTSCGGCDPKL